MVALTFGTEADWYRNVLAAGGCTVIWNNTDYEINKIEPMTLEAARPLFALPLRLVLRLRGTRDFVLLKIRDAENV